MGYRNTRVDVEHALRRLNEAAKDLDLGREFSVQYGSSTNGIQHVLEETYPGVAHPTQTPIGKTFREAHDYLVPMEHALRSVKRDRDYRRSQTISLTEAVKDPNYPIAGSFADPKGKTSAPVNSVGIYDPDARSVTRSAEEVS